MKVISITEIKTKNEQPSTYMLNYKSKRDNEVYSIEISGGAANNILSTVRFSLSNFAYLNIYHIL